MPHRKRNNNTRTAGSANFTADEFEVAGVLFNLPDLVKKSESFSTFLPPWSVRKKRSSIQPESPAPPSNSPPVTGKLATVSTSPVSPMAFPSSIESDLKLLCPKKKASVVIKEELLKQTKKLTDRRKQLQTEKKKMEAYRDELMAENKLLQFRRQEMIKASLPISQSESLVAVAQPLYHQQPLTMFQYQCTGPTILDSNGSAKKNTVRLEHPQPSDFEYHYRIWMGVMAKNRAATALARRSRSLILKAKKRNRATRGSR